MNKLIVKVNHKKAEVTIKRGFFGPKAIYGEDWFISSSINDMIADFISTEVQNFTDKVNEDVRG